MESFFALTKEEAEETLTHIRRNTLALVHYGFSREEVMFMPIGELVDYIRILSQQNEEEELQRKQMEAQSQAGKVSVQNFKGVNFT